MPDINAPDAARQMLVYDITDKFKEMFNNFFAEIERWENKLVDFVNSPSFFWR